jgi:hypothetical protein
MEIPAGKLSVLIKIAALLGYPTLSMMPIRGNSLQNSLIAGISGGEQFATDCIHRQLVFLNSRFAS